MTDDGQGERMGTAEDIIAVWQHTFDRLDGVIHLVR